MLKPQLAAGAVGAVPLQTVLAAFVGRTEMSNKDLYEQLSLDLELDPVYTAEKKPVGTAAISHNLFQRSVRWHQQSLRRLGVIERMDRGRWRLTDKAKQELTPAPPKQVLIAFSTDLGVALWGNAEDIFKGLNDEVTLCFTSPPYPLAKARQYGNETQQKYVDWLVKMMEPIVKMLRPGGNVVLNLSNDIFEPGLPSRSLYLERVTLAMHDKLGLKLMDRFVWENPCKPPGPMQWSSLKRVQANVGYEPVLWFTNCPERVIADNRRCLEPHTEQQIKLMTKGGEGREGVYSGGAYRLREGSFSNVTEGRIPRNILKIPHGDPDQRPARDFVHAHGIPAHPATMPIKLAEFFVKFLSDVNDLVVDPMGGWVTTGKAAERNSRRWLVTERCREYIGSAAERFKHCKGFEAA